MRFVSFRRRALFGAPNFPRRSKPWKIFGISLSLILINMAAVMERADENLLPSVYKEVSEAFGAGPTELGYLTFIRNLVQALASPLAGVLVLHFDRPTVLAIGTVFWALSTAAVGVSREFWEVACFRAINGFGLAIVIPALQSFIADSYHDGSRGAGFGLLSFIGSVGGIGGGVFATIMAGKEFWGIAGWRFAFISMAFMSWLIGILVYLFVDDPGKAQDRIDVPDDSSERTNFMENFITKQSLFWSDSWEAMKVVIKVKTFQIIVLQGIVGSLPWTAMVFFTMWFELIGEKILLTALGICVYFINITPYFDKFTGFDHNSTAILLSLFAVGCALGSFLGGIIADKMSRLYPNTGRIMCAQFSAFMSIPFSWILLRVIPQSVTSWNAYAITLSLMGLTISWCATCANNPIFAEVVPSKHRTMIYAFDRAFEGSFSSFAAPAVGILSEKIYGYDPDIVIPDNGSTREAYALSKGLYSLMAVPWLLCCLFYTPLYARYKRDRKNAKSISSKWDLDNSFENSRSKWDCEDAKFENSRSKWDCDDAKPYDQGD